MNEQNDISESKVGDKVVLEPDGTVETIGDTRPGLLVVGDRNYYRSTGNWINSGAYFIRPACADDIARDAKRTLVSLLNSTEFSAFPIAKLERIAGEVGR